MPRRKRSPFPDPPPHLSLRAQQLWRELGPRKAAETGRQVLFQRALELLDRADTARAAVAADGLTQTTERSGVAHAHPAIRVEQDAHKQFVRLWCLLDFEVRDDSLEDLIL